MSEEKKPVSVTFKPDPSGKYLFDVEPEFRTVPKGCDVKFINNSGRTLTVDLTNVLTSEREKRILPNDYPKGFFLRPKIVPGNYEYTIKPSPNKDHENTEYEILKLTPTIVIPSSEVP